MVPSFKLDEKDFPPLPGVERASVTREVDALESVTLESERSKSVELLSPSPRASSIELVKEVDEKAIELGEALRRAVSALRTMSRA